MNPHLFPILFICAFVLSACGRREGASTTADVVVTKASDASVMTGADSLRRNFSPIINGVWVLSDYIQDIEKTKSPIASSHKLENLTTLIITDNLRSDSLEVGSSLNNHEGYSFMLYFKKGQSSTSLKTNIPDYKERTNRYELGYETAAQDTALYLYHYTAGNKLLGKTQFKKVSAKQTDNDAAWGIQHVVNQKLFSGSYMLKQEQGDAPVKVIMNDNGAIEGLSGAETYYVLTDFVAGPFNDLDQICFNLQAEQQVCYAYRINGDTLSLFEAIEDTIKMKLVQGKLKYEMVKQTR